jgi:F0F1-type ATP synthase delta subunit
MISADLLAENNRLDQLDRISDTFDEIMSAVRGEVKATVTTAQELDSAEADEIKKGLCEWGVSCVFLLPK